MILSRWLASAVARRPRAVCHLADSTTRLVLLLYFKNFFSLTYGHMDAERTYGALATPTPHEPVRRVRVRCTRLDGVVR